MPLKTLKRSDLQPPTSPQYFTKIEKTNDMKLVRPKKFLGQHFLKDLSVAQAIADTVDACPDIPVLEVGPGMGVLTQF